MVISADIICSWQFIASLANSKDEVYLEPRIPFVGSSYGADNEINQRIARFEGQTGLVVLDVCLRGFKI